MNSNTCRNTISMYVLMLLVVLTSCTTTRVYIVRHAEKAPAAAGPMMSSDVPLSDAGYQRAEKLKALLAGKNMVAIYSTQTKRTVSTAMPLSELLQVPVQFYSHRDTLPAFIERVRKVKKGTVLIVGHSNTVDDLVNQLMNQSLLQDLPETEYDNLFLVTRKGTKWYLRRKKY